MVDHVCVNSSQGLGICQHKGILPVSWHGTEIDSRLLQRRLVLRGHRCAHLHHLHLDGVGYFLLSICSAVAGASGMGGGPIFVPILILTFGFEAEFAIPLSKVRAYTPIQYFVMISSLTTDNDIWCGGLSVHHQHAKEGSGAPGALAHML